MEQDLRDEGAARSQHVVHVLPSDDPRIDAIVRAQVERIEQKDSGEPATLRLLVLVPLADDASRIAGRVNDGLDASGALLTPVTDLARGTRRLALGASAAILSPALAKDLLGRSAIKLDALQCVVLLHLERMVTGDSTLDELLSEVPRDADRVATSAEVSATVDAFLERHARRPRRMQHDAVVSSASAVQYVLCDRGARTRMLADLFDAIDPKHATVVAAEDDAEAACSSLAHLGYGPEDPLVSFSDGDVPKDEELVVLYSAPVDAADVDAILAATPNRVVALVAPDELTGFLRTFGHASPAALPSATVRRAMSSLEVLRDAARGVLRGGRSLHHELVALAPLFVDRDPAEVAAALLVLLERQAPAPVVSVPRASAEVRAARPPRVEHEERDERPAPRPRERAERPEGFERPERAVASGDFTPVFINVGIRDGAKKGDLVGALTNESGISSELLGKITMRDVFSVVDVASSVAEKVIASITGKTIRGRVVNARVDRKPEDREDRRDVRRGGGDRPVRRPVAGRGTRDHGRPERGGSGGGGGRSREGFGGGRPSRSFTSRSEGDRPRRPREDSAGPRTFRDNNRERGPRAIGESREWGERGERLGHSRRPRRDG